MENLSAVKKAHVSALMAWNGMEWHDALALANKSSCEELNNQSYAAYSILAAKTGIEKHLLGGQKLDLEILAGEKAAPAGYFDQHANQINQMDRSKIMQSIMVILKEIHDNWVVGNAKKYNRDAEKQDKRLFQHLPIQMIGIDEVAKDMMFLAPILETVGVNVGNMQKEPWGQFIPTKEVADTYKTYSKESLSSRGITGQNLSAALPDVINTYAPLQGATEIDQARKQYMLDRVDVLSSQVKNCLDLEKPLEKNI